MSGHNPHSHLSQPNSSWNPLQIPSYIPRQPQLAHMSNERPLVRSPLTWHTPTPPEALYSFISANHKNLELNPMIPSFVRGPAPFGSMDLTIQSVRNSTTPSPRNLATPPPEFAHNKSITCNVSQNSLPNSISPSSGVIQTTASIREKYTSSNGKNGEFPTTGSLIVRDARQINNELVKLANREHIQDTNQPVELVKESSYPKSYPPPTSPKGMSPSRPPSAPVGISPASPIPESKGLPITHVNPMIELVNNHITMITPQKPSVDPVTTESSPMCSAVPSPANTTSNEDSVDSSASKTRRKRKPNKTVRVANDSDDSLPSNNEVEPYSVKVFESSSKAIVIQKESIPVVESNVSDLKANDKNEQSTSNESNIENVVQHTEISMKVVEQNDKVNIEHPEIEVESKPTIELPPQAEQPQASEQSDPLPQTDIPSVIVDNTSNRSDSSKEDVNENTKNNDNTCTEKSAEQNLLPNCSESLLKETIRKGDSDDIETIDKIAAMIADTNEAEAVSTDSCLTIATQKEQTEETDAQNSSNNCNSKLNDLTEILTAPLTEEKSSQETTEIAKENCFEEVENKLEEMFAGIEEERPFCVEPPPIPSSAERASDGVTCDLGLELPVAMKNEKEVQKDEPIPQKRSHSIKHDEVPPKKKRKIVKKPLVNQLSVKPKSKPVAKCTTPEKPGKEKIKSSESSNDFKYKGPYIQLKPDGSIIVVNTPITEDDNDKQNKVKKTIHSHTISERSKIRGLHVSTLSTKYDADTTDVSWMCVFCKKGPHKMGLGDLFGPYFVSTSCEEFELSQIEPSEDEFISKRSRADMFQKHMHTLPVVPAASAAVNIASGSLSFKKKRKTTETTNVTNSCTNTKELLFGMTKVSETSFEVWAHENCAVWAPGVYLVGARIVGLEAAVWASTRYICSICSQNGAMICCLQRGCSQKAHISCAQTQNWNLNETEFKSFCSKHSSSVS